MFWEIWWTILCLCILMIFWSSPVLSISMFRMFAWFCSASWKTSFMLNLKSASSNRPASWGLWWRANFKLGKSRPHQKPVLQIPCLFLYQSGPKCSIGDMIPKWPVTLGFTAPSLLHQRFWWPTMSSDTSLLTPSPPQPAIPLTFTGYSFVTNKSVSLFAPLEPTSLWVP